jgi:hypothetical protein
VSQENVGVVRRLFDVFNRQDAHGADDLLTYDEVVNGEEIAVERLRELTS